MRGKGGFSKAKNFRQRERERERERGQVRGKSGEEKGKIPKPGNLELGRRNKR